MIKYFKVILSMKIHHFSKNLIRANQTNNGQLVNNIYDELIDLRNAIIKK